MKLIRISSAGLALNPRYIESVRLDKDACKVFITMTSGTEHALSKTDATELVDYANKFLDAVDFQNRFQA